MDIGFIGLLLLDIITVGTALWVVIFIHELGHAIPMLFMSSEDTQIFIGSFGDPVQSVTFRFGRLRINTKYNPLKWVRGFCKPPDEPFSVYQKMLYVASGPLASVIILIFSYQLLWVVGISGAFRLFFIIIFFLSFSVILGSMVPRGKWRFNHEGNRVSSDSDQLISLYRARKFSDGYWKAMKYLRVKNFSEAVLLSEELIKSGQKNVHYLRLAVIAHSNNKTYDRAVEINGWISDQYKLNADDYANAGFLCIVTGNIDEAVSNLEKCLSLRPNHVYSLNNMGYVLAIEKRYAESLIYLDLAISIAPAFANLYENRAFSKIQMDDFEGGMEDNRKCLKLDDKNAGAYRNWGIYFLKTGDLESAELMFIKAKDLDKDTPMIDSYLDDLKNLKTDGISGRPEN